MLRMLLTVEDAKGLGLSIRPEDVIEDPNAKATIIIDVMPVELHERAMNKLRHERNL